MRGSGIKDFTQGNITKQLVVFAWPLFLSNLLQVVYAIAAGFLFTILFYKTGSLLACIAAHSVLNALSVFANEGAQTVGFELFSAAALTVISLGYAWFILKKTKGESVC